MMIIFNDKLKVFCSLIKSLIFIIYKQTKNYKKMANSTGKAIATQSQLKFVLDYSIHMDKKLSLKDIVSITNVLVEYVENGYTKELGDRIGKIDEYLEDK